MERDDGSWRARLPADMQDAVVAPQRVESFHDDSVPASKWRGYDADGTLCWYRHSYQLWDESFDDDDEPCLRMGGGEVLEAWRCRDGSWLRRLIEIVPQGLCGGTRDSGLQRVSPREVPRL